MTGNTSVETMAVLIITCNCNLNVEKHLSLFTWAGQSRSGVWPPSFLSDIYLPIPIRWDQVSFHQHHPSSSNYEWIWNWMSITVACIKVDSVAKIHTHMYVYVKEYHIIYTGLTRIKHCKPLNKQECCHFLNNPAVDYLTFGIIIHKKSLAVYPVCTVEKGGLGQAFQQVSSHWQ